MALEPLAIVGMDVRKFVRPDATHLNTVKRRKYEARCRALQAVATGSAVRVAAEQNGVDARTVKRDAQTAVSLAPDGSLTGFRACLPYRRRRRGDNEVSCYSSRGRAHAMTRLVMSNERIAAHIEAYRGPLPTGVRKNRQFDKHAKAFRLLVAEIHGEDSYPLQRPDKGRRALLDYHKRLRKRRVDAGAVETPETPPAIKRISEVIDVAPLERLEFDAHREDVDWVTTFTNPAGDLVHRRIRRITLVAVICAVSRYLLAHLLVVGEPNRIDILRLFRRVMMPWRPRQLIVPNLRYFEGARLGLPADARGAMPRGIEIAGDNALAHLTEQVVEPLLRHHRGVLHFGRSRMPEGRPIIEAFFKRLEDGALRKFPGGFQPGRPGDKKTPTSYLRADEHPFHWEGMCDVMDVLCANYNVTPHNGLREQRPVEVLDRHLSSNWAYYVTDPSADARALTTIRLNPRIRGGGSDGRYPFVEYQGGTYRSPKLIEGSARIGTRMVAEVDIEDMRDMILLDDEGAPWSRLRAAPPWGRSPHDLHLRQQINRARNRGLLEIAGSDDAVACWIEFTRSQAEEGATPPDAYLRAQALHPQCTDRMPALTTPSFVVQPRFGRTSFAHRKD